MKKFFILALILASCKPAQVISESDVFAVDTSMAYENPESPGTFTSIKDTIQIHVTTYAGWSKKKTKYQIIGK